DEDALPEDAARHETAVVEGPPLVAVAPARHADVRLARRGFLEPALGHDGLAVRPGALEDEKAEAGEVARRGLDAAAADLAAGAAEDPGRVLLHPRRLPDLLGQVVGKRPAGRPRHQDADEIGLARAVVPAASGRRLAREVAHVAHQGV